MQSKLFSPLKIGDLEIKNRIVMPPMCMYKAKDENGCPRCFHRLHYAARALGGVGLIIVEATAVEPRGRITSRDLGLWSGEQLEAHARLVKECVKYGAAMVVQLAHAGRKSECNDLIAPSAVKFSESYKMPRQMSADDIVAVKQAFVQAAIRAQSAGYAAIEIHAAHGYLISEFLSPGINLRDDEYGGSFENRTRFLKEILSEIKPYPQILLNLKITEKKPLESIAGLKELEASLAKEGIRSLFRYSGTENLIRLLLEGKCADALKTRMDEVEKFFVKALNG